jgi:hypothetical protein
LITVVGFSIYKSYYISEQKTKYIDVYRIFANEYIKRINENKTLHPNPSLNSEMLSKTLLERYK